MKHVKLLQRVCGIITSLAMIFSLSSVASAASYYGIAQYSDTIDGTYFYAKTQSLDSKWNSTTGNTRFILHTTWIANYPSSGGDKWIEVGFVDGAMQGTGSTYVHHNGFYTATGSHDSYGNVTSYSEYIITGPSTSTGLNHNYQIQRTGTSDWGVYVDYTLYGTYRNFATSCDRTDVGLETNYTGSTSGEWNERAFQVLKNGSWSAWTSGSLYLPTASTRIGIDASWDSEPTSIYTSKS